MTLAHPSSPRTRRFTRDEYHRMAEDHFFDNQRVELIDGEIIEMAPQHEPHARAIMQLIEFLAPQLKPPFKLRCQMPLSIGNSEPEPDVAIVTLPLPKETAPHTAALVVEVADSSLHFDRKKAHLYASAQIPEYWLVNLVERSIERFQQPVADASSPFSAKYALLSQYLASTELQPASVPLIPLTVATLFETS